MVFLASDEMLLFNHSLFKVDTSCTDGESSLLGFLFHRHSDPRDDGHFGRCVRFLPVLL